MANYRSFILRVRDDEPDEQKKPRRFYLLLDARCGYRRAFTSLEQLLQALCAEINGDISAESTNAQIIHEPEGLIEISTERSSD
ncbi:MAG: hypothetical protein R3A44_05675 [Caldilineaceae bacterium]